MTERAPSDRRVMSARLPKSLSMNFIVPFLPAATHFPMFSLSSGKGAASAMPKMSKPSLRRASCTFHVRMYLSTESIGERLHKSQLEFRLVSEHAPVPGRSEGELK